MRSILLVILGLTVAGGMAGVAGAQDAADGDTSFTVGYVRLDYILERSDRISEKVSKLQKEYRAAQATLDQRNRAINDMRESFEKRRDLMSIDSQNLEMVKIRREMEQYREDYESSNAKLEAQKRAVLEPEVDWLWQIVDQIGAKRGFDLILDEADIAYGAKEFDMSNDVLAEFDQTPPPPRAAGTPRAATTTAGAN